MIFNVYRYIIINILFNIHIFIYRYIKILGLQILYIYIYGHYYKTLFLCKQVIQVYIYIYIYIGLFTLR